MQRKLAENQRNAALEQRKLADMQLAPQAWEEGDLQRANDLIDASRPAPRQPPGFEWRYLRKLCQDQSTKPSRPQSTVPICVGFRSDLLLLNDNKALTPPRPFSPERSVATCRSGWNLAPHLLFSIRTFSPTVTDDTVSGVGCGCQTCPVNLKGILNL